MSSLDSFYSIATEKLNILPITFVTVKNAGCINSKRLLKK